ncbi:hypothetical protein Tco_0356445 [Tanacetum coccineum]
MLKASAMRHSAQSRILELDKLIDKGLSNNDNINERISLLKDIHDLDKRALFDLGPRRPRFNGLIEDFYRPICGPLKWMVIREIKKAHDVVNAVKEFFSSSKFPPGSNSSFITLIHKSLDAKMVKDFRPIGALMVVFTRSLLRSCPIAYALLLRDLISDVHIAFISKRLRFGLDGDYLDGVLNNFGFGVKWRGWIQACLSSAMGSILVNGSPSSEFKFHKGIRIDESLTLSHLFYADDAVFIGKWDKANVITIVNMLKCFYLVSGLKINIQRVKIMGIGYLQEDVLWLLMVIKAMFWRSAGALDNTVVQGSHARIFFSLVLWPETLLPNWLDGGSLIARIYSHTMIGLNGFTLFVSLKVLRIYWKGSFTLCGG